MGVTLICRTADRTTAEPVEPAEPTEPKEMTVLLQLPLANMIKQLVTINFLQWLGDFSPADWSRAIVDDCTDHWKLLSLCLVTLFESSGCETESPRVAEFRLVSSCRKENKWYRIKHSRTRERWGYDWRLPSLLVSTSCYIHYIHRIFATFTNSFSL